MSVSEQNKIDQGGLVSRYRKRIGTWTPLALMAEPRIAGVVALIMYLARVAITPTGFRHSGADYYNFLADAFLHGQLALRTTPESTVDLIFYMDRLYLYWNPFPALLIAPLVALFGIAFSDVLYTALIGALTIGLSAHLLSALDGSGIAPLDRERRGLLVTTLAFGSIVPIVATRGNIWDTAQIVGWACVLCATLAALIVPGRWGYLLTGLALTFAMETRLDLLFNGVWLAFVLLRRDGRRGLRWLLTSSALGLSPLMLGFALLGWYNAARFGNPLDSGLAWHNMSDFFRADYARYGVFNLHYLPTNLYHHFLAPPITLSQKGTGWGFFFMTPVFVGALYALWRDRCQLITSALAVSAMLTYIPIGLVMGTGYLFGPRYLLDLMVPIVVLTARGIAQWPFRVLRPLFLIGIATFMLGWILLLWFDYAV
jgi:hypothetical protein